MKANKRIDSIIRFLKEAEKLKLVERIPFLSNKKRLENDAEHSWNLLLMLMLLKDDLKVEFDLIKTYEMLVIHDLVEIYTGDDWVYDKNFRTKSEP